MERTWIEFDQPDGAGWLWVAVCLLAAAEGIRYAGWGRWPGGRASRLGLVALAAAGMTAAWGRGLIRPGAQNHAWACGALALFAGLWLARSYRRTHRPVNRGIRLLLQALRIGATLIAILLLARPVLRSVTTERERAILGILLDNSRSMTVRDVTGTEGGEPVSRLTAVTTALDEHRDALRVLAADLDVYWYTFANGVQGWPPESTAREQWHTGTAQEQGHTGTAREQGRGGRGARKDSRTRDAAQEQGHTNRADSTPPPLKRWGNQSSEWPPALAGDGPATALGDAVAESYRQLSQVGRPIAGVIVMSDGRDNASSEAVPVEAAAALAEAGVALHGVGVGSATPGGQAAGLRAQRLDHSPQVGVGDRLAVRAEFRAAGLAGMDVDVELLIDDAPVDTKRVGVTRALEAVAVEFTPVIDGAGLHRVTVRALPADGGQGHGRERGSGTFLPWSRSGEHDLARDPSESIYRESPPGKKEPDPGPPDGRRGRRPLQENDDSAGRQPPQEGDGEAAMSQFVQVTDDRIRVLYVDRPRYERAAIGRSLASASEFVLRRMDLNQPVEGAAPGADGPAWPVWPVWREEQVILLGDVDRRMLADAALQALAEAVQEYGCGLAVLGGMRTLGSGRYGGSALDAVLGVELEAVGQWPGPIAPELTPAGRLHPVTLIGTDAADSEALWRELPPLTGASRLGTVAPAVEVLLKSPQDRPLLAVHEAGRGRVAILAFDSTWQWPLASDRGVEAHRRFWRQLVLWLAKRRPDLWLRTDRQRYALTRLRRGDQQVHITAGTGDAQQDDAAREAIEWNATLIPPQGGSQMIDGARVAHRLSSGPAAAGWEARLSVDQAGEYRVRLIAMSAGAELGRAEAGFIVEETDAEMTETLPDLETLRQMAAATARLGGTYVPIHELERLLAQVRATGHRTTITHAERYALVEENPWIWLAVFVGLLSIEWIIRRRAGLA